MQSCISSENIILSTVSLPYRFSNFFHLWNFFIICASVKPWAFFLWDKQPKSLFMITCIFLWLTFSYAAIMFWGFLNIFSRIPLMCLFVRAEQVLYTIVRWKQRHCNYLNVLPAEKSRSKNCFLLNKICLHLENVVSH